MHLLMIFLLIGMIMPLTTYAQSGSPESPKRVVILGDSLTAGYGLDPSQAYPSLLQKRLDALGTGWKVVNAGVSGDTTAGGVRRIDWSLSQGAEILIIALGGNDGLRGVPVREVKKNLEAMIERARAKAPNVKIILSGMQMPESMGAGYASEFGKVFAEVARARGTLLIPYLLEGVGGVSSLNQPDGIHPTLEGQKRLAETVWKTLEPVVRGDA